MPAQVQKSPWQSILAGGTAGGLEALLTYPTEYLKTRQQLYRLGDPGPQSPFKLLSYTIRQHGLGHFYTGSMAFCVSNAAKSSIRFFAFDTARRFIPTDVAGKMTALGNMSAGMIAGVAEAVIVVTPGETLKTKIIDDRAGPKVYKSASHAICTIVATEGLQGLYRGVVPVTLKQSANSMVRFTSYNVFLDYIQTLSSQYTLLRPVTTLVAGAMAGVVTVYATMPFDTVKTRLQAIDGSQRYRGSIDCMRSVAFNEGISALWKGTTPRLIRLSISGALSFTIYENVITWTESLRSSSRI